MKSLAPKGLLWLVMVCAWVVPAFAPGAPAAKNEAPPKKPIPKDVQAILDEVSAPALPGAADDGQNLLDKLPPDWAAKYPASGAKSELRNAIRHVRVLLWAVSTATPPADLAEQIAVISKDQTVDLTLLHDGYCQAANENIFRKQILADQTEAASLMAVLTDALENLQTAGEKGREQESKRWQANYDLTLARLQLQIVQLFEYQSMLGQMRKDTPPLGPGQNGWKLVSRPTLQGDPEGKRMARETAKMLARIIEDNPDTPWAILAGRLKEAPLGLEWQGAVYK